MAIADCPGLMVGFGRFPGRAQSHLPEPRWQLRVRWLLGSPDRRFRRGLPDVGRVQAVRQTALISGGAEPNFDLPGDSLVGHLPVHMPDQSHRGRHQHRPVLRSGLEAMGEGSKIMLGIVLAGIMTIDIGGPFNKVAYVFCTLTLATMTGLRRYGRRHSRQHGAFCRHRLGHHLLQKPLHP